MPVLTTVAEIQTVLLPVLRGATHVSLVTDSDDGRLRLSDYAAALGTVGVTPAELVVAHIDLFEPSGRTVTLTTLAVLKAAAPPNFARHVAAAYGIGLSPDHDIIVLCTDPEFPAAALLSLIRGRLQFVIPGAN